MRSIKKTSLFMLAASTAFIGLSGSAMANDTQSLGVEPTPAGAPHAVNAAAEPGSLDVALSDEEAALGEANAVENALPAGDENVRSDSQAHWWGWGGYWHRPWWGWGGYWHRPWWGWGWGYPGNINVPGPY